MKPIGTNNLTAWGYIGLLILFSLPYIGTPAMIILAIFGQDEVRSFSRACLILSVGIILLFVVAVVAVLLFGFMDLSEFEYIIEEGGIELFRRLPYVIG